MEITVQFVTPLCLKHQLPFEYMCMAQRCNCELRLCYQCVQEHQKQNHHSECKRFDQYQQMIQKLNKDEYNFIDQYEEPPKILACHRREQINLKNMQMVKEMMISDKVLAMNGLKQFKQIYDKKCTELNRLNNYSKHNYLYKLKQMNLAETVIHLTNQHGLDKLHTRIKNMKIMTGCYRLYLEDMSKYGQNYNTFDQCISLSEHRINNSLQSLIKQWKTKNQAMTPENSIIFQLTNRNNQKGSTSNPGKENKKALSPAKRKIFVVTPPKKTMKLKNK